MYLKLRSLKQYLLFEVSFVLVLLLELLLGGLAGKHIASGKLGGLDVGEAYKRNQRVVIILQRCGTDLYCLVLSKLHPKDLFAVHMLLSDFHRNNLNLCKSVVSVLFQCRVRC